MKKNILLFMSCLGLSVQANSTTLVPVSNSTEATGASFTYSIKNADDKLSNTFMSRESIDFQFNINVKSDDVGQPGQLYFVAHHKNQWYQKIPNGQWVAWDKKESSLSSFSSKVLEETETMTLVKKQALPEGEYLVFGGYQTTENSPVFYNNTPASLVVFDESSAALHPIENDALFGSYFSHWNRSNSNRFVNVNFSSDFSGDFSPPVASDAQGVSESSSSSVSQTNLQEKGVDEADRIKTDGEHLYTLEACQDNENKTCLSSYTIQASPAQNTQLQQLDIVNADYQSGSIYLAEFNSKKHIIHHSNSANFSIFGSWFYPSYWQNNQTDIKIIDVSQPQSMMLETHITMDTSIISSRMIDGVLYLITRKNPSFSYPDPIAVEDNRLVMIADTSSPDPVVPEDGELTTTLFNPMVPIGQTTEELLPTISFNDGADAVPLVQTSDCYIPSKTSNKSVDNTIITITAIPLDNPTSHYSSCIAGAVDTFYMSPSALYLATSRYSYSLSGNEISFAPESSEMTTEIHKFALAKDKLDYRGSGTVLGHLGWDAEKQPFRFGEYDGVLKIATSKGNNWDETSTTSVTVLREASEGKQLEQIGFLDNLGKPGERLFAARFIQNKGYLVTFKQTDPLYVLDFTQPDQPAIVGELEINGYSDYLHPIGDDYLLGIGKDATEEGLYQGVKLSLFDVSSAENLREVSSVILGKRGTESAVLQDHHALAWLPSEQEDTATLAIPVQLNIQQNSNSDINNPWSHYGWTHTGLYTFEISTGENPSMELQGKLITDTPPNECDESGSFCSFTGQYTYNDRAVIQDNTIHYIHNNAVHSSAIADLE